MSKHPYLRNKHLANIGVKKIVVTPVFLAPECIHANIPQILE